MSFLLGKSLCLCCKVACRVSSSGRLVAAAEAVSCTAVLATLRALVPALRSLTRVLARKCARSFVQRLTKNSFALRSFYHACTQEKRRLVTTRSRLEPQLWRRVRTHKHEHGWNCFAQGEVCRSRDITCRSNFQHVAPVKFSFEENFLRRFFRDIFNFDSGR